MMTRKPQFAPRPRWGGEQLLWFITILSIFYSLPAFILFEGIRSLTQHPRYFSPREFVTFAITCVFGLAFFVGGRNHISGTGISVVWGLVLALSLVGACSFLLGLRDTRKMRQFSQLTFTYIVLSALYTAVFFSSLVQTRDFVLLFTTSIGNSTNFMNVLALCCAVLLLVGDKSVVWYSSVALVVGAIWQNRTCVIITAAIILFTTLRARRFWLSGAIILVLFLVPNIRDYISNWEISKRFGEEGFESTRWAIQTDALYSMLRLEYPFGGYDTTRDIVPWLHNVVLDVYRVIGIIPATFMALINLLILSMSILSRAREKIMRVLVCVCGLIVAHSSVVLEGHILEILLVGATMCYSQLIPDSECNSAPTASRSL